MTTTQKSKFEVELKFKDTTQVLMLRLAIQEAIDKRKAEQCSHNFREKENILRDLRDVLEQLNQYKLI